MLEPLVKKVTRAGSRRERRGNPPNLSNGARRAIFLFYPTARVLGKYHIFTHVL